MCVPARFVRFYEAFFVEHLRKDGSCAERDTVESQISVELPSCDVPESGHPFGITRAHGRSVGVLVCTGALATSNGVYRSAGAVWVA